MKEHNIGKWAFLIGILLSIISAFTVNIIELGTMILILFLLGLVVGFLSVNRKRRIDFLIATIFLLVLGVGGISALSEINALGIYQYIVTMLGSFIAFVGAAGLVVAIKEVLDTNPKLDLGLKRTSSKKK